MWLDEMIVWRLSYANTPLHVIHTNNNINKNYKKKTTNDRTSETKVSEKPIFISNASAKRDEKERMKEKILLCRSYIAAMHTHINK